MLRDIIIAVIVIIIVIILGYRLKYQFWSRQPVFHYHNLKYWLFPPGIIQHKRPEKNKYYDHKIHFDNYFRTPTEKKALFASFIRRHYMPHKSEKYSPTKKGVLNYFKSHNNKAYLSMMYDKNNMSKLIGTMSTRPLDCYIKNHKILLYYVDFLCVHQNHRKKGIAPKIIYSHYYNSRVVNDNTVFLFKREGERTLIVPLCIYNTYLFNIYYWDKLVRFDQPTIRTVLITEQTFDLFVQVFERLRQANFTCLIVPNISHLKLLVKDKQLFVCVTLINNEPYDCFIFRNTYTTYDNKNSVEFFGSFQETEENVFVLGFFCAISLIYEFHKFDHLFIENISNNNIIIKNIIDRYKPVTKVTSSYYFYNFAYRPFKSNDVFILN